MGIYGAFRRKNMKITDISTDEDRKNRIIRIDMMPENKEENMALSRGLGLDTTPDEVNLSFSLETSADNA